MSVQCTHIVEFLVEHVPNCTNMYTLHLVSYLQMFVDETGSGVMLFLLLKMI